MTSRRSVIRIAAIDDEPFSPEVNLRNFGYNIIHLGDIKSIAEVNEFPIILCDIMGVGRHFGSSAQGGSLIKEISENFPTKILVAYTGASLGSQQVKIARQFADEVMKKDADIAEWTEILDSYVLKSSDPSFIWTRARKRFVEIGLDTKVILILEDAYVRSILRKEKGLDTLQRATEKVDLKGNARGIVQGLIASILYAAIFGA